MNIIELKEKLLQSIELWAEARIDEMVRGNQKLAIPSIYIKRASHNVIAKNKEKWSQQIDLLTLFIADENGDVNTDTVFEDLSKMLWGMDVTKYDFGIIHGSIGNGVVSIDLPDNMLTTIFFGNNKTIRFTTDDLMEMKSLIIE